MNVNANSLINNTTGSIRNDPKIQFSGRELLFVKNPEEAKQKIIAGENVNFDYLVARESLINNKPVYFTRPFKKDANPGKDIYETVAKVKGERSAANKISRFYKNRQNTSTPFKSENSNNDRN